MGLEAEMPENETLVHDARNASRWRAICERMNGGLTPIDAFPDIQRQFYLSFRRAWRQWIDRGLDPGQLFEAALNDRGRLELMIRQANFDENARLLRDVAVGLQDRSLGDLIQAFLGAAWDNPRSQLRLDCLENSPPSGFNRLVDGMLKRMLRGLLKDPSRFPSQPPRKAPKPSLDLQLGESLL